MMGLEEGSDSGSSIMGMSMSGGMTMMGLAEGSDSGSSIMGMSMSGMTMMRGMSMSGGMAMMGGDSGTNFEEDNDEMDGRKLEEDDDDEDEDDDDEDEDSKIGVRSSGKKVHEIPPKQKVHKIADENKESEGGILDSITSYMPSMPENPLKGFFGEEEELLKDDAASLEEDVAPMEDGDSWF